MSRKNTERMVRQMRIKVIKINFLILNEIIKYEIFDETFINFTILLKKIIIIIKIIYLYLIQY